MSALVRGGVPQGMLGPLPRCDRRRAGRLTDGEAGAILQHHKGGGGGCEAEAHAQVSSG